IELNEAQFIALERDKKREREKSIWEFENKGGCQGEHILSYGTSPEQREEKVLEVKEMEEVKEETREKKSEQEKETSQQDLQQEIKK
ncbi:9220_t:CDS:1, partial [Cetraspora pellucida]